MKAPGWSHWRKLTGAMLTTLWTVATLAQSTGTTSPSGMRPWTNYQVILWIGDSVRRQPSRFSTLLDRMRELGATAGMVFGREDPAPWSHAGVPYYVENMINRGLCLKWNSRVRDWSSWIDQWARTRDPRAFVREYGLYDPAWRAWARAEARDIARLNAPHQPLAYNLRDELSITISANPFDYDFSEPTLEAFRTFLRRRYGQLEALNRAWGTQFAAWSDVRPFTTDEIKHRMVSGAAHPEGQPDWSALSRIRFNPTTAREHPKRWNLAPWCEFRSFLDDTWAGILDELRQTVRQEDPATPVGIEGTQMPHAFGGFDLWKLAQVCDWMEPYDVTGARAILGSFMPGRPLLSTIGEADTARARRRLWHLLLEGDRGCIVWWSEDCLDTASPELALTAKGRALAPALHEMRSPLATLIFRAQREFDPVAIHYSQPSIQVAWLIESTVDGRTWPRRFSSYEARHNRHAARRMAVVQALRRAGISPRFLASAQLEAGALERGWRGIVLPSSYALSDAEVAALRQFEQRGGRVLYDGEPGAFDEIGRLRAQPVWPDRGDGEDVAAAALEVARPPVRWTPLGVPVVAYRYRWTARGEPVRLVAFEYDTAAQMNEDLQVVERSPESAVTLQVTFDESGWVSNLTTGQRLGQGSSARIEVRAERPTVLAITRTPPPEQGDLVEWLSSH